MPGVACTNVRTTCKVNFVACQSTIKLIVGPIPRRLPSFAKSPTGHDLFGVYLHWLDVAAVAEWYSYRIVACLVTSSSPVPLKTRRVGQQCTLNLSRAETSSRWCGVVVRRGGASSGVVHVT
ncbi:uncharacterized protein TNCV_4602661 [Trichonephila clavipes]|nr:uncharacterized protein TNCV_4602661 [Trichonephila clavipes]